MNYTTESILLKLQEEKEENSLVSKQLLDETNLWINRFTAYPNVTFELIGEEEPFLTLLENNIHKIEETVYMHHYNITPITEAATEEEAGVMEGYMEIDEEPEPEVVSGRKKTPTLTVSFDELYNMFSHMKGIVDQHTSHIQKLQKEIEIYKNPVLLPPPVTAATISPAFDMHVPEPTLQFPTEQLQETPPMLFGDKIEELDESHVYTDHHEEIETENIDSFDNFEEATQPQAPVTAKPKLDKKKKTILALMIFAAIATTGTMLFMPSNKKPAVTQMQPPTTINAPAAPAAIAPMKNLSTAKTAAEVKPAIPTATPAPVVEVKEQAPVAKPKYVENMTIYIKVNNDNIIRLKKGEQVVEIQGQDTENWTFVNNPENNTITFSTRTNKLRNTIIVKTNKKTYTLNLVSSNKGNHTINLAD